jgi:IclR family transcriptional regulator, KDG regulon repressor
MLSMPKVLDKTLDILELFKGPPNEYTLSEISRLTQINITTIRRIISNLVKRNYMFRDKDGKYYLGSKFIKFSDAAISKMDILRHATPLLENLRFKVGESVVMTSWDGLECIVIYELGVDHMLKTNVKHGKVYPLYCSANGKAILAAMTEDELNRCLKDMAIERFTAHTIMDLNELRKQLISIRKEGIAFELDEMYLGVSSAAAALMDHKDRVVGAIGVIGPSMRLTYEKMKETAPEIRECALKISSALGYSGQIS